MIHSSHTRQVEGEIINIAVMPRCLHIFDSGFQCIDEAVDGSDFCDAHQKVVAFQAEQLEDSTWRKSVKRFVALVLLLLFLIPLYYTLKDLYFGGSSGMRIGNWELSH